MSKTRILEMPKIFAQKPFLEFFVGLHNKSVITYVSVIGFSRRDTVSLRQYQLECLKTI